MTAKTLILQKGKIFRKTDDTEKHIEIIDIIKFEKKLIIVYRALFKKYPEPGARVSTVDDEQEFINTTNILVPKDGKDKYNINPNAKEYMGIRIENIIDVGFSNDNKIAYIETDTYYSIKQLSKYDTTRGTELRMYKQPSEPDELTREAFAELGYTRTGEIIK